MIVELSSSGLSHMGSIFTTKSPEQRKDDYVVHALKQQKGGEDVTDETLNGFDCITQLPTDLLKLKLCEFLFPYEQFKFARINTFFASIYGKTCYNFKYFSDRDRNCWFSYIHPHYVESGGWLLFKNKAFDRLPAAIRLCLMYFIIHYDQILRHQPRTSSHENAIKLRQIIPQNVNHLRIIGSENKRIKLTEFIRNILYYSSSINPINAIYVERCNLSDSDVCSLSYSLIQRKCTSNLRGFSIGGNPDITDQYIGLFLDVISKQCPSLRTLGLHSTNITNKACRIILDFYATKKKQQKQEERKEHLSLKHEPHDERSVNGIVLEKLYLMRNAKITEKGIDILNEIFVQKYLDDTRLEHQVVINCARCGLQSRKDSWNRIIRV
eukprot:284472_1